MAPPVDLPTRICGEYQLINWDKLANGNQFNNQNNNLKSCAYDCHIPNKTLYFIFDL